MSSNYVFLTVEGSLHLDRISELYTMTYAFSHSWTRWSSITIEICTHQIAYLSLPVQVVPSSDVSMRCVHLLNHLWD